MDSIEDRVAPDCRGANFYDIDPDIDALSALYLPADLRAHLRPHFQRMGEIAGGVLDELATLADRNPPVLHPRDRFGRDQDWIEHHPAYKEMERLGFLEFGLQAMTHRGGVLGWPEPFPPAAKYIFTYLFTQAEFGIMCPISVSDTAAYLVRRHADEALKAKILPGMLSQDADTLLRGTQFMTEKQAGSDVGLVSTEARLEDGVWRLYGDKWFCSHADADIAMILARPKGAPAGTKGLGLFALPRRLDDGTRNRYRIVRLKDKLGTKSMASGEIVLEGAEAWPVGDLGQGFKQMMDQVNLSRLSHGVRAAGMMRRCLNEALACATGRQAFGGPLIDRAMVRRQLMKTLVPTEQALSMALFTADIMAKADAGDARAAAALRLLTPLVKFRACRDNLMVATAAMEMRGGTGYIEEWVNARLVRDAQVGVLWEGTSNIVALDAIDRAVGRADAQLPLGKILEEMLVLVTPVRPKVAEAIRDAYARAAGLAKRVSGHDDPGPAARKAAGALYHAISAAVLGWEGAALTAAGSGSRRLDLAEQVLRQRLSPVDPLEEMAGLNDDDVIARALLGTGGESVAMRAAAE
ncbi:MAG: acyl-CoA dehydrogenase family protein [Alphaproteobacteria bacterium]|nr:acyl-CoA dehydrogenase family protein [Alphaproteobacteria bacterium]